MNTVSRYKRNTNILIKIRAKMVKTVYKSDLLILFLFLMVFAIFFNYLTWIYEPPELMNTRISAREGQRLIQEWKVSRLKNKSGEKREELSEVLHGANAIQGPDAKRESEIYGDIPEFNLNILRENDGADRSHDHDMADLAQLEHNLKHNYSSNVNLNGKSKLQLYESIRKLLAENAEGNSDNRDVKSVIRLYQDQEKIQNILKTNGTSFVENWRSQTGRKFNTHNLTSNHKTQDYVANKSHTGGAIFKEILHKQRSINNTLQTNHMALNQMIENIDQESKHVLEMKSAERDHWLDERAEDLFKEIFHKDPKRKSTTSQNEVRDVANGAGVKNDDVIAAPVGGRLQGGPAQCTLYDVTAKINETFECLPLDVKPPVKVCIYPTDIDIHISKHIRQENIWEGHIVKEFQNILFANPDYGVIDIGANIGIYSLIAASMGHVVVAVEPYINNIKHFHLALQIGGLADKVTLLRNAVFERRRNYMSLALDERNQGGIAVDPGRKDPCLAATCTNTVKAVLMDDLLEVINFRKAVMKIDIEGFEHRAFKQSSKLFDQVMVTHIIMEWRKLREYYGTDMDQSEDKDLVHALVAMLFGRGFRPFSLVTSVELKRGYWYAWPDDIIWKNDLAEFFH